MKKPSLWSTSAICCAYEITRKGNSLNGQRLAGVGVIGLLKSSWAKIATFQRREFLGERFCIPIAEITDTS